MIEFLQSIKLDLLSRRMLPLVVLLAVAFIAAVGYAISGGSGSSAPVLSASLPSASSGSAAGGDQVSVAPENPHLAVSETPGGAHYQSQGPTRDPFVPLPSAPEPKSNDTGSSGSKTSRPGGSSTGSTGTSGLSTNTGGQSVPSSPPAQPTKPQPLYVVSAALALGPTSLGQPVTVTPYDGLKPHEPLPSKQDVRLSFERVTADGKGAVFKLVVAPIIHGPGLCLPSASECQSIDLAAGQVEELEYVEPNGQTVSYALKVLSITKVVVRANAARVNHDARTNSKAHAALVGPKARPAVTKR